ncbi:LysR family transcriptional regulator [Azospirillum canadense]|uniref:LysR family transcriptional regulator n=1 Tax=Azospirillum canadense TaxID=403962 RepID=UPI0022260589|nr:LysR family transcriptional regulator [Azospirillum canadense]MCW2242708.1 DNA-binding transcriptional LysR family regulator [Azospirillum canadense]
MDWGDLRFFVELARSGSLSATARRLKVDHTTVARRVAALEDSLGVRLFDRLPRGYALTTEGEEVAALAGRLEEGAFAIERFARGQSAEPAGTVRLSAPPVFASAFLAPNLGPFRTRFPQVVLELIGDSRAVSLTRREADLAIRLKRPEDDGLVSRRVGTMGYGLYAAPAHLEGRAEADWEFVGYDESLDHVPQQRWLRGVAAGRPFVFRANDLGSLASAARAGLGVAALPHFLGIPDPGLVRLPSDPAPEGRELWLLVHGDLRRAARVRATMDFLIALLTEKKGLLEGTA